MKSMTGFGRGAFTVGSRAYAVAVRTVNNRFLDVRVRLPWPSASVEAQVTKIARGKLSRGRLEVTVSHEGGGGGAEPLRLNDAVADDLAAAVTGLAERLDGDRAAAAALITAPRDLLTTGTAGVDEDDFWAALGPAVGAALDDLTAMRDREGAALRADLATNVDAVASATAELRQSAAGRPQALKDRLESKIAALVGTTGIDPTRIAQEVALLAERADVHEELVRLDSHVDQLREMLASDQPIGRKIEFMIQEVNRELNTVASKASDAQVATMIVDAKGVVEKMREQAQNVE